MERPPNIDVRELIDRYDALLLDAYGVLVHRDGIFGGADDLIDYLNITGKAYFVVTNDASRLPSTLHDSLFMRGLNVPTERLITAGSLLIPHFQDHDLGGAACLVLGTHDSRRYVKLAGGTVVELDDEDHADADIDALIVCDNDGFDFIPTLERALTMLIRAFDAGREVRLVVANPDLMYPTGEASYGLACGSVAVMLEQALALRFPGASITFERLGKPYAPLYEEACRRAGTRNVVMVGDQLETDIRGANDFKMDSALAMTGLTQWSEGIGQHGPSPTYLLQDLFL